MKEYIYRFADGTKSVVEVSDELYAFLKEEDKREKFGNRRETRRHVSLDELAESGIEPPVFDKYDYDKSFANMLSEKLHKAIKNIDAERKDLLYAVFYERKKLKEIAEEQKVLPQVISWRLRTTLEQLRLTW